MQLEKVKRFITENSLLTEGDKVVLAVSGGPDSLCLLYLLHSLASELKISLVVAHLNHGLRPEGPFEAEGVAEIAAALSLPFELLEVDIPGYKKAYGLSEEVAGRQARYSFLFDVAVRYGATKIALGHHLDDQAETVLLNVLRGTGVDGLAGILPIRTQAGVQLIRPLLCLRRSEIDAYCYDHGLQPYTDSSNLETNYTRNKLRHQLIPYLEEHYNPRVKEALFGLADLAAADRAYLQKMARRSYFKLAKIGHKETIIRRADFSLLPGALQGRVLRLALQRYLGGKQVGRKHIQELLAFIKCARTGQQQLPGGAAAYLAYDQLILGRKIKRDQNGIEAIKLQVPGKVIVPGRVIIASRLIDKNDLSAWPPSRFQAYLDYDTLPPGPLQVCSRLAGIRFHPQGAAGSKKLKDFLIDQKVPAHQRDRVPLVISGEKIIWVAGLRIDDSCKVTEETKCVLLLEYRVPRLKGNLFGTEQE
jgi:tRNA(Ile)-lysidine synthase